MDAKNPTNQFREKFSSFFSSISNNKFNKQSATRSDSEVKTNKSNIQGVFYKKGERGFKELRVVNEMKTIRDVVVVSVRIRFREDMLPARVVHVTRSNDKSGSSKSPRIESVQGKAQEDIKESCTQSETGMLIIYPPVSRKVKRLQHHVLEVNTPSWAEATTGLKSKQEKHPRMQDQGKQARQSQQKEDDDVVASVVDSSRNNDGKYLLLNERKNKKWKKKMCSSSYIITSKCWRNFLPFCIYLTLHSISLRNILQQLTSEKAKRIYIKIGMRTVIFIVVQYTFSDEIPRKLVTVVVAPIADRIYEKTVQWIRTKIGPKRSKTGTRESEKQEQEMTQYLRQLLKYINVYTVRSVTSKKHHTSTYDDSDSINLNEQEMHDLKGLTCRDAINEDISESLDIIEKELYTTDGRNEFSLDEKDIIECIKDINAELKKITFE